ncbi:MAG: hypothetical protein ACKVJU_11805 [Verrucomicrobiales bacterium]
MSEFTPAASSEMLAESIFHDLLDAGGGEPRRFQLGGKSGSRQRAEDCGEATEGNDGRSQERFERVEYPT